MPNGRVVGIRFGAALAALTMLAVSAPAVAATAAQTRPNILIVLTDDQRLNGAMFEMPKTLSLFGDGGTQFTNYCDTTPLCCPSRGSIWSGEYAHNHGVLTNGDHAAELAYDQTTTLQSYLQGAGYETAIAGKYWNTWSIGTPPPYFDRYAIMAGSYNDAYFGVDGKVEQVPGYTTNVIGRFADGFLQDFEATDSQSWFLYVAPEAPHDPFTPSARYADATLPKWNPNPAFLESDRTDKPPWIQCCTTSLKKARHIRGRQLKTLMSVDDMVGSIFDELAALGETNTIAIFTSDNGMLWGEHGRVEKRFPYTQSIQVPFFLRWPGHVAAGATDDRLTANIDIEPTILDAVGITPTHTVDGASIFGPNARARLHLEYFVSPDAPLRSCASTLTPTYQYVEWYKADGSIAFREYYDEVHDPWQLTNLLHDSDPSNDPRVPPLHSQVVADRLCAGATCPQPVPADVVAPTTPGEPSGSSTTSGTVDLSWSASSDDTATTIVYYVFRDSGSAPIGSVASASSGTVSFTDSGLVGGSKHTYRVQASDGQNLSQKGSWSSPIVVAA